MIYPLQQAVAILTPIKAPALSKCRRTLAQLHDELTQSNKPVIFDKVPYNHFARWVIIEATDGEFIDDGDDDSHCAESACAQLLFSANIDGDIIDYVRALITADKALMQSIYACCVGFPAQAVDAEGGDRAQSGETIERYLLAHSVKSETFYIGQVGRTRNEIKREQALREALENFLDQQQRLRRFDGLSALQIRRDMLQYVYSREDLWWALTKEPGEHRFHTLQCYAKLGVFLLASAVVGVVFGWLLLALGLLGWWYLDYLERHDVSYTLSELRQGRSQQHLSAIILAEDNIQQNPMTSVTTVKRGMFRQFLLKGVLSGVDFLAETVFHKGHLGGIPTIHFARWMLIDEGRRLVFLSNYDGSWESYLGDFIDRAAIGLTAIWSNTQGFPATRWLFQKGARDEPLFKAFTRSSQIPTHVWYSAYKRLSVDNIRKNAAIRKGLRGRLNKRAAQAWLRLF